MSTRDAVIVSTARTPIGRAYKGAFNATPGPTLGAFSLKPAIERAGIEAGEIEAGEILPPEVGALGGGDRLDDPAQAERLGVGGGGGERRDRQDGAAGEAPCAGAAHRVQPGPGGAKAPRFGPVGGGRVAVSGAPGAASPAPMGTGIMGGPPACPWAAPPTAGGRRASPAA